MPLNEAMKSGEKAEPKLTIGRLADAAGVGLATVLYYQRRGLLPQPEKPPFGGFRVYGNEVLERLLQIKSAQKLGFTLAEILELLAHLDTRNCDGILALAEEKLSAIEVHMRELGKVQKALVILAEHCRKKSPENCLGACAIMKEISETLGCRR